MTIKQVDLQLIKVHQASVEPDIYALHRRSVVEGVITSLARSRLPS